MECSEVPEYWKQLIIITAICKKKVINKVQAITGLLVCLTFNTGKLMEISIKQELVTHLEHKKLITASQHGFFRRKYCWTNLLEYLQNTSNVLDGSDPVDVDIM